MTIKKKFMTLFNNRTHTVTFPGCKTNCLEHVVVFGKLIWVVEGDWDGTIIYKRTNSGGITGRVVSTSAVTDASGNSCTKIVFRTKTRLSIPRKKNFFNACRNNNTYGLDLDVLPDKTVLKFVFKQKIMLPQNFVIPVGVDPNAFPIFLNNRKYNDSYKELASQFEVSLPRISQKTSKLICNYNLNTVPTVQDTVTPTCTIPKVSLMGVTSNTQVLYQYFVTEQLTFTNNEMNDNVIPLYIMNSSGKLKKAPCTCSSGSTTIVRLSNYNLNNNLLYNRKPIHTIYYIPDLSNPNVYIEYYSSSFFFSSLTSNITPYWKTTTCL